MRKMSLPTSTTIEAAVVSSASNQEAVPMTSYSQPDLATSEANKAASATSAPAQR